MAQVSKLRVTKDYEKLSEELKQQIKLEYPFGFSQHLITFKNREGKNVKAIRFETEDRIYLVRMTVSQAVKIVMDDDDFDDDGFLKQDAKEVYEGKFNLSEGEEVEAAE